MAEPRHHFLTRERVHYQWDATLEPVLEIDSGDTVTVDAPPLTEDQLLPGMGPQAILDLDWSRVHALVGPVYVRGAEPGDALEIRVHSLQPSPWGVSWIDPTYGLLMDDFSEPAIKFLDLTSGTVEFAPGLTIPLAPFLGVMGVAPPGEPRTTYAPGSFGGNLDCKELTVGSRLFLPVQVPGALFSTGDGHAVQGDGELCSAIECGMAARLEFHLHKGMELEDPLVHTDDALMTIGHADNLEDAARAAARSMIDILVRDYGLSRSDAYIF
jgi:acetamidase/formamidase